MKFIPHTYQEKAIAFGLERQFAGFFLRPGQGKTSIILAIMKLLKKQGFAKAALVLAPLRPTYLVWPQEVEKWDEFRRFSIGILHGPRKDRVLSEKHDLYLMNYEGLGWLSDALTKMKSWPFDVLVADESTRLKHTNTQRFKILKPLLQRFKRRYILTGTPAPNGLMDLFGQAYVMDRGQSLGPYITHFRNEFFYQTGYGGYTWLLKPGAEKEIHTRLSPRVFRLAGDVKLPPLTINDVWVDLPPKARSVYNQLEGQLRVDFLEGRVTAANAAVASMKCRQVANGGIYLDGTDRDWKQIHDEKAEAAAELVEELSGDPVLIAYEFKHDLARLKKVLGDDVPHVGGGVSVKRSIEIERDWNAGKLPVLLGQPQSVAHGLNLQAPGRTIIMAGLTWNYEDYDQFISRIRRQGQTRPVILHRILARNTVDEVIVKVLTAKGATEGKLMGALNDYWKGRKP